jgi:hypothetical protein
VKEAIALFGKEQQRHGAVLEAFMQDYDMPSPSLGSVQVPHNLEPAFIDLGYRACLDSLVAFGLFGLFQKGHRLPAALLQPFDTCLSEEARHLILFTNCLAYRNAKQKKFGSQLRGVQVLWQRRPELLKLLRAFGQKEDEEIPAQQWLETSTPEQFLNICLAEHHRRMQGFPTGLVQPQLSPALAKVVREVLRVWPKRQNSPTISALNP